MSWLIKIAQTNRDTDFQNSVDFAENKIHGSFNFPHFFWDKKNWIEKMSTQKLLIIIRGPSGSGKSRMSQQLAEQYNVPVFSSDDYFMKDGEYQFDASRLGENHELNRQRTEEAMKNGQSVVIVDNTNTKFWEMRPYVLLAQKYGYTVDFKEPDWNSELRTPEGKWNVDFLEKMQSQPDREKTLPRDILERTVQQYEYNPTVESVLQSERPERRLVPQPQKDELEELA